MGVIIVFRNKRGDVIHQLFMGERRHCPLGVHWVEQGVLPIAPQECTLTYEDWPLPLSHKSEGCKYTKEG